MTHIDTAESDSAMSCSPRSQILPCLVHRGVRFCRVLFTAESDSTVSCSLQSQILSCLVHHGVRFPCVLFTAESNSAVSCSPRSQIPPCLVHRGVRFRCVLFIMESDSAVSCSLPSQIPPCLVHRGLPSVNLGEIKTVPNTQQYLNLFVWALWGLHDENLDLVTHNEFIQIFSLFSAVQPAHNRLHRRV